jgi:membrane protein DedA with SNARE-associated domain
MNAIKFAIGDLIACTISCSFFFWLYFTYGEAVIDIVKKGNITLFTIAVVAGVSWFFLKRPKQNDGSRTL